MPMARMRTLLRYVTCCVSLTVILSGACQAQALQRPLASSIVGRWQYIQSPDSEGEVLDIVISGDRYIGIMNGLERAGEHGLFYYVVKVSHFVITIDGKIRFVVGPRLFHRQRPALSTLDAKGDGGGTQERMVFSGRLEGAELLLQCSDRGASCPDSVLRFRKILANPKLPQEAAKSGNPSLR